MIIEDMKTNFKKNLVSTLYNVWFIQPEGVITTLRSNKACYGGNNETQNRTCKLS